MMAAIVRCSRRVKYQSMVLEGLSNTVWKSVGRASARLWVAARGPRGPQTSVENIVTSGAELSIPGQGSVRVYGSIGRDKHGSHGKREMLLRTVYPTQEVTQEVRGSPNSLGPLGSRDDSDERRTR